MQELEAQLASTKQELLAATTAATKYKVRLLVCALPSN